MNFTCLKPAFTNFVNLSGNQNSQPGYHPGSNKSSNQQKHEKSMHMKKTVFTLLLNTCLVLTAFAQASYKKLPDHKPDELIVQLAKGADINTVIAKLNRQPFTLESVRLIKPVLSDWRIFKLGFDESQVNPVDLMLTCQQMGEIQTVDLNYIANDRGVEPNDPDWYQQGDMTLIHAPDAWMASTGGVTHRGDTVVVAVLEKGVLLTHPDLAPNRFWNWHEIPHDGIDNDNNGYIDDFGGWNPATLSDDTGDNGFHGTGVYGIIGAVGNNSLGVSGVNWNVKMLNVCGASALEDIISGCRYVYDMRRLYNQTNGAKGAFVVATNYSFGFDNYFPTDMPGFGIWCTLFDSLGMEGVLSIGATANHNVNVDVDGDMPTSCGSEYLITVTNISQIGQRDPSSGYGIKSIDLGAPGTGTYTTTSLNSNTPSYGILGGTSAATPHVSGSVALLYTLGCDAFTSDAVSNPAGCARRMRDVILNNTTPNASLDSITFTGGQLDLSRAVAGITELCDGAVGKLDFLSVKNYETTGDVVVYFQTPVFLPYKFRVFNMLGQQLFSKDITPDQFSENSITVNTKFWPRGVYVFSLSRGNAIVSIKFPKI